MSEPVFSEGKMAAALGVSREQVRAARQAYAVGEWQQVGHEIRLTEEGLQAVLTALGLDLKGKRAKELRAFAEGGVVGWQELEVIHVPLNRHLVMARHDANGPEVRVRVRSNENFLKGMRLSAVHAGEDLFDFVGRLPRWRGKW